MDTYIGRAGNQASPLKGEDIGLLHCMIEDKGDGYYQVTPTNVRPTYINDERIFSPTMCEGRDILTLGTGFSMLVEKAYTPFDAHSLTDWGMVADRCGGAMACEAFDNIVMWEYEDETPNLIDDNAMAAQAFYLVQEGKLRQAQELLYDAGDDLYARQDGSPELMGAYAGVLGILAELYAKAGRMDVAATALKGARQLLSQGAKCSPRVVEQIDKCTNII